MTAVLCRLRGIPPKRATSGFLPRSRCTVTWKHDLGPSAVAMVALIVIVVVTALAIVPSLQVTVPAACVHGAVAETKVSPAARGKLKTTLAASDQPLFFRVTV